MVSFTLSLLLVLLYVTLSQSVALYDANEKCYKSSSLPNVTILLDTSHYNVMDLLGENGSWVSINDTVSFTEILSIVASIISFLVERIEHEQGMQA